MTSCKRIQVALNLLSFCISYSICVLFSVRYRLIKLYFESLLSSLELFRHSNSHCLNGCLSVYNSLFEVVFPLFNFVVKTFVKLCFKSSYSARCRSAYPLQVCFKTADPTISIKVRSVFELYRSITAHMVVDYFRNSRTLDEVNVSVNYVYTVA